MALNIKVTRLDFRAPSIQAEYARALDLDFLGKVIVKNFFVNVLDHSGHRVDLPIGRFPPGLSDGQVTTPEEDLSGNQMRLDNYEGCRQQ